MMHLTGLPRSDRPDITPGMPDFSATLTGTEARVCADIAERQRRGVAKYGTTVASNPLPTRQWLQHAYEEALDFAIYLRRAIEEMDEQTKGGDA